MIVIVDVMSHGSWDNCICVALATALLMSWACAVVFSMLDCYICMLRAENCRA